MSFWQRMQQLDRRIIYTLIFISVIIPTMFPLKLPTAVTPETQSFFNAVDSLPAGSRILFPFDCWPSTRAETEPMAVAVLRHCFRKNIRVVGLSNVGMGGPSVLENVMNRIAVESGKVYGVDYVNLGYKANYQAVLLGMGSSIETIFPADHRGTRLAELPLMSEVPNYDSLKYTVVISDNAMIDYWVSLVNARYSMPMVAGVTAVMAPKQLSYVQAGQLGGLLGGMKGAAEYETLVGAADKANRGMDSQSLIHLLIIGFIVLGNVGHFITRNQKRIYQGERG